MLLRIRVEPVGEVEDVLEPGTASRADHEDHETVMTEVGQAEIEGEGAMQPVPMLGAQDRLGVVVDLDEEAVVENFGHHDLECAVEVVGDAGR